MLLQKLFRNFFMMAILVINFVLSTSNVVMAQDLSNLKDTEKYNKIFQTIKDQLIRMYGYEYNFENFNFIVEGQRKIKDRTYVDINVDVDMTLTLKASDNSLIQGMKDRVKSLESTDALAVENYINNITEDINELYGNKRNVQILYSVNIDDISEDFELFSRFDISEDKSILTKFEEIESSNKVIVEKAYLIGFETASKIAIDSKRSNTNKVLNFDQMPVTAASGFYNRVTARDWARDHRADYPEFDINMGQSDCANFVSKALNQGGIPKDTSKWYPASTWGNLNTAGTWWYRTGFYTQSNGLKEGVTTYMVDKGWFYSSTSYTSAFAGAILYNTTESHVGLVTAGDGVNVYYADHSNVQRSGRETFLPTAGNSNFRTFKFYLPYSSILK